MSAIGLRPYLPDDLNTCIAVFRAAIADIASEDYSEDQCEAWAATADDAKAFATKLSGALTLIATLDGGVAGFVSLKGADVIDMLYVAPEAARQGVASALVDAISRLAAARGAAKLTTDASDTAKPLFEKHGFIAERRNLVTLGDEWLANTTMCKTLNATAPAAPATTRH